MQTSSPVTAAIVVYNYLGIYILEDLNLENSSAPFIGSAQPSDKSLVILNYVNSYIQTN